MPARRLLGMALLLGGLVAAGLWLKGRPVVFRPGEGVQPLVPAEVTVGAVQQVMMWGQGQDPPEVQLGRRPNGHWHVATRYGAPADEPRVQRLLEALMGLQGEERARGAEWYEPFGVGGQAIHLVLAGHEQEIVHLLLGRSPTHPDATFVRAPGGLVIYAVEPDLIGALAGWPAEPAAALTSEAWVDRRLVPTAPQRIRHLELAEWVAGAWVVRTERHAPFDGPTERWLDRLVTSDGETVLDPEQPAPAVARWRWIILEEDGTRIELEESAPDPPGPFVVIRRLPEGPRVTVRAATWERLRDDLLPPPAPPPPSV